MSSQVSSRTLCLWDYLEANREALANPFYRPGWLPDLKYPSVKEVNEHLFLPPLPVVLRGVTLWDFYLAESPKESFPKLPSYLKEHRFSEKCMKEEEGGGGRGSDGSMEEVSGFVLSNFSKLGFIACVQLTHSALRFPSPFT